MTPTAAPSRRARARAARLVGAVAAVLATSVALGACDLRLETPPPSTPTPDAAERVRDAAARDAVALAAAAEEAAAAAPVEVAGVLVQVAEVSRAHAGALGGVYAPFPEASPAPGSAAGDADPGATPTPTPTPPADADAVLGRLAIAATAARTDADAVADGALGRLLASVAVSRLLLAESLASATGAGSAAPDLAVPGTPPAGLSPDDLAAVVRSEDAAGLVWEVAAARSADPARRTAAARAVVHRDRAQAWAEAAGVAGTPDDPRRGTYDLPEDLIAAGATQEAVLAVGARVETQLAALYASLLARADAGARGDLVDAVAEYARQAVASGAPVPPFPGLPERG